MDFPLIGTAIELRPFTLDDVAAAHEVYSDPRVMRYVGHGPVGTVAGTESIIRQFMAHQQAHGFGFWAVVDRASGTLIGDAGLARAASGEIEMGYTLGTAWWGRGLATEAAGLCVAAARGPLRIPRLRALVEAPNGASQRVLTKLGFTLSGTAMAFGREHLVYRLELSEIR
ncbi:MAG: GNAT family N-acetyltransferase [Solirubrobacteraceae bacterium]|nr:GNAT family N-acetyltransferase [Patulibacter sp.]